MPEPTPASVEERRRRRAFVLAHHPDRGGDAETFVTGLAALQRQTGGAGDEVPTVYRRRRGLAGWLGLGRPRPPNRTLR